MSVSECMCVCVSPSAGVCKKNKKWSNESRAGFIFFHGKLAVLRETATSWDGAREFSG